MQTLTDIDRRCWVFFLIKKYVFKCVTFFFIVCIVSAYCLIHNLLQSIIKIKKQNKTKNETQTSPAAFDIHPWCVCTCIPSIIAQGATSRVELIDILLTRRFLFVCIWCESQVLLRLARNVWFCGIVLTWKTPSPVAVLQNFTIGFKSECWSKLQKQCYLRGGRKQKWRFD